MDGGFLANSLMIDIKAFPYKSGVIFKELINPVTDISIEETYGLSTEERGTNICNTYIFLALQQFMWSLLLLKVRFKSYYCVCNYKHITWYITSYNTCGPIVTNVLTY